MTELAELYYYNAKWFKKIQRRLNFFYISKNKTDTVSEIG
jgi:hypothetical protein